MNLHIDASKSIGPLQPFWKSTGFMPGSWLEKPAMQESLRRIAATQPRAIEYLRPHYLLDFVTLEGSEPNWTRLDASLDFIVKELGFKLIFEVMGNPSNYYDFKNPKHVSEWRSFTEKLILHLQERYGKETVRSWWFECTNEPDFEYFWKAGDQAFLDYYDATWDGIKKADPVLRFGGPANALGLNDFFKKWAAHVDQKKNVDFITVHRKETAPQIIVEERKFLSYLNEKHPALAKLPFCNTEADPEYGWADRHGWRAHAWYAAFVAQSIDLHLREIRDRDGVNYAIGLNDNGFMGDFGQRTLFAFFKKSDGGFELVKKPVMAGMELLAQLGETRLMTTNSDPEAAKTQGAIATRHHDGSILIYLYSCPDIGCPRTSPFPETPPSAPSKPVTLHLKGIPFSQATLTEWVLEGAPALTLWVESGKPENPSSEQFKAMRAVENPKLLLPSDLKIESNGSLILQREIPPSSVRLLKISPPLMP